MKIKKLKPVGIQVIIIPDEPVVEINGIIIPDSSREDPLSGKVLAIGMGRPDYIMTVKVGEEVKYPRFGWTKSTVEVNGQPTDVIVIKENEIFYLGSKSSYYTSSRNRKYYVNKYNYISCLFLIII